MDSSINPHIVDPIRSYISYRANEGNITDRELMERIYGYFVNVCRDKRKARAIFRKPHSLINMEQPGTYNLSSRSSINQHNKSSPKFRAYKIQNTDNTFVTKKE